MSLSDAYDRLHDDLDLDTDPEGEPPTPLVSEVGEAAARQAAEDHLRAMAVISRRIAVEREVFDAEIHRITDRLQPILDRLERRLGWHQRGAEAIAAQLLAGSKVRTITLPHGELSARWAPKSPKVEVVDEEAFARWAILAVPELVGTKTVVLVSDVRRAATVKAADDGSLVAVIDGEIPPGLGVSPARETFRAAPAAEVVQ